MKVIRELRRRSFKAPLSLAVACGLAATLAACGSEANGGADSDTIRLGIVTSLTGPAHVLGLEEMESYELAVKLVNAEGGIDGRKVEFVTYDDKSTPEEAVKAVQRLISQDQVVGIIGGLSSTATLAVKPVVQDAQVPLISAHAAVATTADNPAYLFRSVPSDRTTTEKMVEYMLEQGWTRLAVMHDSNAYGTGARDLFEEVVGETNGAIEIVAVESFEMADTDMRAQLTSIKGEEPDAVVLLGSNPAPAIIVKQAHELGVEAQLMGGTGTISPSTIEVAGLEAAEGFIAVGYGDAKCPRQEQETFIEQFRSEYDKDPSGFNYAGDGMYLMLKALETTDLDADLDEARVSLRDEIEGLSGLAWGMGPWNYAPDNHDGADTDSLVLLSVKDGEWSRLDCQA